jgi:hypothetical protein
MIAGAIRKFNYKKHYKDVDNGSPALPQISSDTDYICILFSQFESYSGITSSRTLRAADGRTRWFQSKAGSESSQTNRHAAEPTSSF